MLTWTTLQILFLIGMLISICAGIGLIVYGFLLRGDTLGVHGSTELKRGSFLLGLGLGIFLWNFTIHTNETTQEMQIAPKPVDIVPLPPIIREEPELLDADVPFEDYNNFRGNFSDLDERVP